MFAADQIVETPLILVPAGVLADADNDPEALTMAAIACIHCLRAQGRYELDELSPHAAQFYLAISYSLELADGGHEQYVHNMRDRAGPDEAQAIFAGAHAGLLAMGAKAQAAVLDRMIKWTETNPGGDGQRNDSERENELKTLDSLFSDAERARPIARYAADWIRQWDDLAPVEDARFEALCVTLAMGNPKLYGRTSASRIEELHFAATDPFRVCLGLAAAAVEHPEIVLRAISSHELKGSAIADLAWQIETDGGIRYSMADINGIAIYEATRVLADDEPITEADIGMAIGRVANEEVDAFLAAIVDLPVGAAADLLLRRIGHDDDTIAISATSMKQPPSSWLGRMLERPDVGPLYHLVDHNGIWMMKIAKSGFTLLGSDGQPRGTVSVAEAQEHARSVPA